MGIKKYNDILELIRLYDKSKKVLIDEENGLNTHTSNYVSVCRRYVGHIDHAIDIIKDPYKICLINDFYEGTFGRSIKIDVSTSTYYRNVNKAHEILLDILDDDR